MYVRNFTVNLALLDANLSKAGKQAQPGCILMQKLNMIKMIFGCMLGKIVSTQR